MRLHHSSDHPSASVYRMLVGLLAVLALTAAACSDDDDDVVVTDPPTEATAEPTTPDGVAEGDGAPGDDAEPSAPGDEAEEPTVGPGTGGEEPEDPNSEGGDPDTTVPDAEPGQPSGPDDEGGIDVVVTCATGSVTPASPIPATDIEQVDDVVNTIDFCEGAGGLASVAFVAPCPTGDRDVVVEAIAGALPDIATLDLCENET